jgi:hypothetical protein
MIKLKKNLTKAKKKFNACYTNDLYLKRPLTIVKRFFILKYSKVNLCMFDDVVVVIFQITFLKCIPMIFFIF